MQHKLPELTYPKNALAPHISEETLNYHHGKHHAAYVNNLNKLIEGTPFAQASLEEIVKNAEGSVFNNAGQHWNHSFYWQCLTPKSSGQPRGTIAEAIKSQFESFDKFKEKFTTVALTTFGSGWAWLTKDGEGKLGIASTSNADTPLRQGKQPLLTCDVWEHAYYIDYRNERAKYLEAFWKVVNWDFVEKNFTNA